MQEPCNDARFPELTKRIRSGTCVAFVGAGLSVPEYVGWQTLVERVCAACHVDTTLVNPNDPGRLQKLAELAYKSEPTTYAATIHKSFPRKLTTPNRYHVLAKAGFRSFVTTNYDSFLLESVRIQQNGIQYSVYPALNTIWLTRGEIFFIHGRLDPNNADSAQDIILTESQFRTAYTGPCLTSFLHQLFLYHDVCFLGCGLSDEHLQHVFSVCHAASLELGARTAPDAPKRFTLLDHSATLPADFDSLGVEVVRYSKLNNQHEGLDRILEYWAKVDQPILTRAFDRVFDRPAGVPR